MSFCRNFLLVLLATFTVSACALTKSVRAPESGSFKLAFGSCIAKPQTAIWKAIREDDPDVLLFLGDNVYLRDPDFGQADRIERKYQRLFKAPGMQELLSSTRVLATWDDHDFGANNSDSRSPGAGVSRQEFHKAWPKNPPTPKTLLPGVAFEYRSGPLLILVPDGRSFRLNPEPGTIAQMYGAEQLLWLKERLAAPSADLVILASGTQWLAEASVEFPDKVESLLQYPEEEKLLRQAIADSPAQVLLISGDRHMTEVLKAKFGSKQVYELTSSPLSAHFIQAKYVGRDEKRIALLRERNNYGLLSVEYSPTEIKLKVDFKGQTGKVLLSLDLDALELDEGANR